MKRGKKEISATQLADWLNISRALCYRYLAEGRIPGVKWDDKRKHWIIPSDVIDLMGLELYDDEEEQL